MMKQNKPQKTKKESEQKIKENIELKREKKSRKKKN